MILNVPAEFEVTIRNDKITAVALNYILIRQAEEIGLSEHVSTSINKGFIEKILGKYSTSYSIAEALKVQTEQKKVLNKIARKREAFFMALNELI